MVTLGVKATTWNTFIDKPVLTDEIYPDDLDNTTLAILKLDMKEHVVHTILDEMLKHVNEDGVVMVGFPCNAAISPKQNC